MDSVSLGLLIGAVILCVYYYFRRIEKYTFWKDRAIPYEEPYLNYGSPKELALFEVFQGQYYQNLYNKYKDEKVIGLFLFHKPALLVKDPELLKQMMTKDFQHFIDRGLVDPELVSPVMRHLFLMVGDPWKTMRSKLTPAFTSGKMKLMYYLMEACANEFVKALEPIASENQCIDIKEFIARFTTDVIATCAFGLEANTIRDPENEFRQNGRKIFQKPNNEQKIRSWLASVVPWLFKMLHIYVQRSPCEDFFKNLVRDTVEYREKNGVVRNDFIDQLIKIKNNKNLYDDDKKDNENGVETMTQNPTTNGKPGESNQLS